MQREALYWSAGSVVRTISDDSEKPWLVNVLQSCAMNLRLAHVALLRAATMLHRDKRKHGATQGIEDLKLQVRLLLASHADASLTTRTEAQLGKVRCAHCPTDSLQLCLL